MEPSRAYDAQAEARAHSAASLHPVYHEDDLTLEEMGIVEDDPAQGALRYTTQPNAIVRWYENDHMQPQKRGEDVITICREMFGIDEETLRACPALEEYWQHADAGRFIGTVAMQYARPTPYYHANLLNTAQIYRASGGRMPVSFMTMVYPNDLFSFKSGDKTGAAFQGLNIPYSVNGNGKVGYVTHDLQPAAILRSPALNLAKGQQALGRHEDQVIASLKPLAVQPDGTASNKARENHQAQYYAARCNDVLFPFDEQLLDELGITEVPGDLIVGGDQAYMRATDFYSAMWQKSIDDLRNAGHLPPEADMPMFTVDGGQLYRYLAEHAQPSKEFLAAHGWDSLPVRRDGIMYGAAYYAVQRDWGSVYHECSSCMYANDPVMQRALPIHDSLVRDQLGIEPREVRLPDHELDKARARAEDTVVLATRSTGGPAYEPAFRAFMKSLDQTLQDPKVQQVFNNL